MNTTFLVFCIVTFIAVLFLLEFGYYWYDNHLGQHAKNVKKRLDRLSGWQSSVAVSNQSFIKSKESENAWLKSQIETNGFLQHAYKTIIQSGLNWTVTLLIKYSFYSGVLLSAALFVLGVAPIVLPVALLIGMSMPWCYVVYTKTQRFKKIESQLPEAIDAMARSLRAGQTIQTAIQLVAEELPEPISREFQILIEENNLGIPFNDTLNNLAQRLPITDLQYFVIAILIQRETGGNLHEILTSISKIIRARFRFFGEVKVLTSEGRMSALVLSSLPFIMFVVTRFLNPEKMDAFVNSSFGSTSILIGLAMIAIGIFMMSRIIKIKL